MPNLPVTASVFPVNDDPAVGLAEIAADNHRPWWVPYHPRNDHDIFERALMKFINFNQNAYDFYNMVCLTHENHRNPKFPRLYETCENVRASLSEHRGHSFGPFGRLTIWKVPEEREIKSHKDDFEYHRCVTRVLYFLNAPAEGVVVRMDGISLAAAAGTAIQFAPAFHTHYLANLSQTEPWFFLALDLWHEDEWEKHSPLLESRGLAYPGRVRWVRNEKE